MIIIKIPYKTPTVNHLYGQRGCMKYLKKEAVELRKEIIQIVKETPMDPIFKPEQLLKVTVEVYEDWYTKKCSVKRKDVSNREKFLIDSVFLGLEVDDKYIFEHTMKKIQAEEEYCIIKIEPLIIPPQ